MNDRKFINALLNGGFISKRPCWRKDYNHAMYSATGDLLFNISDGTMRNYSDLFKEKKGRKTLNLNLVRQQHGNSLLKSLYKKSKQKSR